jgi:prophage regulatory protein
MAPPRKKRRSPGEGHPVHLRLPTDVFERVEAKAKDEGRPFNRIIINELAAFPDLDRQAKLGQLIRDLEITLARYDARIIAADLSDEMLRTVREMVKADDANNVGALRAKVAKVRVILNAMEKHVHKPRRNTWWEFAMIAAKRVEIVTEDGVPDDGSRPRRMLSEKQVLEIVPVGRTTLYRMEKAGRFPRSTYISPNRRCWFMDEVIAWQNAVDEFNPDRRRGTGRRRRVSVSPT